MQAVGHPNILHVRTSGSSEPPISGLGRNDELASGKFPVNVALTDPPKSAKRILIQM